MKGLNGKGVIRSCILKMGKKKRTKIQTMIYKTLQWQLKREQHKSHLNRVWTYILLKAKHFLLQ